MSIRTIPLAIFSFLTLWSCALGRTVVVPNEVPTVQAGLDSLANDDTIYVHIGQYFENLVAPPLLFHFVGERRPDTTEQFLPIIDATALQSQDSVPILVLPPQSFAHIEGVHFRNKERNGIYCFGTNVYLSECIIESTRVGLNFVQDSLGAIVGLSNCSFLGNHDYCVTVRGGNVLEARNCLFTGSESDRNFPMVSVSESNIDSCRFSSADPKTLLHCWSGPHSITNSRFGPTSTRAGNSVIELGDGAIYFSGNEIVDCAFGARVMVIHSVLGDSVEICDNLFLRCQSIDTALFSQGVLSFWTEGEAFRGVHICHNRFVDCFSLSFVDDIVTAPLIPALIEHNQFIRDGVNGLPSIYGGHPVSQPTPVTLRNNIWAGCGYALALGPLADARFNYWDHPSGPFHETANPSGQGDTITGPALFVPWLSDTTAVSDELPPETVYKLTVQAMPNPFNSSVTIEYALAREQGVSLTIFDVLGRQVETLLAERQGVGVHSAKWNADQFPSGLYFARLSAGENTTQTVKLLLMK